MCSFILLHLHNQYFRHVCVCMILSMVVSLSRMIFFLTCLFSVSFCLCSILRTGPASSVECVSAWYADGRWFDPPAQHSFVEIDYATISTPSSPRCHLLAKGCALG